MDFKGKISSIEIVEPESGKPENIIEYQIYVSSLVQSAGLKSSIEGEATIYGYVEPKDENLPCGLIPGAELKVSIVEEGEDEKLALGYKYGDMVCELISSRINTDKTITYKFSTSSEPNKGVIKVELPETFKLGFKKKYRITWAS